MGKSPGYTERKDKDRFTEMVSGIRGGGKVPKSVIGRLRNQYTSGTTRLPALRKEVARFAAKHKGAPKAKAAVKGVARKKVVRRGLPGRK